MNDNKHFLIAIYVLVIGVFITNWIGIFLTLNQVKRVCDVVACT